jgi:hypothetical protein
MDTGSAPVMGLQAKGWQDGLHHEAKRGKEGFSTVSEGAWPCRHLGSRCPVY